MVTPATIVLFHLHRAVGNDEHRVTIKIAASDKSPLGNPAFVVDGWGSRAADLKLNGKVLKEGETSAQDTSIILKGVR